VANGALTATVTGNINNYRFNWYAGNSTNAGKLAITTPFINEILEGIYTLTVTDLNTGCTSPPVSATVLEDFVYPEYEITIQNASCDKANGLAQIISKNGIINKVIWETHIGIVEGNEMFELPVGNYRVTVIFDNGCSTSQDFSVGTDINVYNGVSPNGDGRNDIFKIDCIQLFPTNNVKIFNRSGTLVYEMNGYDNTTVFFYGVGNRGMYLIGNDLPDGTYFYVIEKNDGSKPKTGYLELLR
jgi:gliding motility-associated-like protein